MTLWQKVAYYIYLSSISVQLHEHVLSTQIIYKQNKNIFYWDLTPGPDVPFHMLTWEKIARLPDIFLINIFSQYIDKWLPYIGVMYY